jgi:hypothetical protein
MLTTKNHMESRMPAVPATVQTAVVAKPIVNARAIESTARAALAIANQAGEQLRPQANDGGCSDQQ